MPKQSDDFFKYLIVEGGGLKGKMIISEDAPQWAKDEYAEYIRINGVIRA